MAHEWKTLSVRVNEEKWNAIQTLCRRRNITKNELLAELVGKEVRPILSPDVLPEGEGLPQTGIQSIKYVPETDSFVWQVDLGPHGITTLSEDLTPTFVENLRDNVEEALAQRAKLNAKLKKTKKIIVPKKILKYGGKQNVNE